MPWCLLALTSWKHRIDLQMWYSVCRQCCLAAIHPAVALLCDVARAQIVSEAAMRLPEEVYRADGKGDPRGEEELTHEERRRRRAQHKRAFKNKTQQKVRA